MTREICAKSASIWRLSHILHWFVDKWSLSKMWVVMRKHWHIFNILAFWTSMRFYHLPHLAYNSMDCNHALREKMFFCFQLATGCCPYICKTEQLLAVYHFCYSWFLRYLVFPSYLSQELVMAFSVPKVQSE